MHLTIRQRHADFILELRKNLYDLPKIISSGRSGETENLSDIPLLTEEEIMGLKEFVAADRVADLDMTLCLDNIC